MNQYEIDELRKHWKKPGRLKMLLATLPLTPEGRADSMIYKKVVWMTGISFREEDFVKVYDMLEEDGVIARDAEQAPPAVELICGHEGPRVPCHWCDFQNRKARIKAGIRYHLTKPLEDY
jgi:hypothetical protein